MRTVNDAHRLFHFLLWLGIGLTSNAWGAELKTIPVEIQGQHYTVEVADNDKTRTQGLSGRTELAPDHGMLFRFAQSGSWYFWMIDMHFPLDILWIDSDQHVLSFVSEAEPCIGKDPCSLSAPLADPSACHPGMPSQCPVLASPPNTQYVLELNAGTAKNLDLHPGTPVHFELPS